MTAEQGWRIRCATCSTRGPEAPSAGEARNAAEKEGWYIGSIGKEDDFCQTCRIKMNEAICECGTLAMYQIIHRDELYPVCGKHQGTMIRDLFYSYPHDDLTIRRLRGPIKGGKAT